jgi:hypothetical protein
LRWLRKKTRKRPFRCSIQRTSRAVRSRSTKPVPAKSVRPVAEVAAVAAAAIEVVVVVAVATEAIVAVVAAAAENVAAAIANKQSHCSSSNSGGHIGVADDPSAQTNLPGFKIPFGSRQCLIFPCNVRTAGETARGHQGFLAKPMPCSPVITPSHAKTCLNN